MSKFLNLVAENTPENDLDSITKGKRMLQKYLIQHDIMATATQGSNDISIVVQTDEENVVVELEVKSIRSVKQEESEDIEKVVKTVGAVMSIPSQSLKQQLLDPTARKVQIAKRALADKLVAAAKKITV